MTLTVNGPPSIAFTVKLQKMLWALDRKNEQTNTEEFKHRAHGRRFTRGNN